MKKKELLVVFVLAVLVTMVTAFWEMARRDIFFANYRYGFPLDFFLIEWFFITRMDPLPFVLNVFLWFLVLAGGWWVIKKLKTKK